MTGYDDLTDDERQYLFDLAEAEGITDLTDETFMRGLCGTLMFQAKLIAYRARKLTHEGLIKFHNDHRN